MKIKIGKEEIETSGNVVIEQPYICFDIKVNDGLYGISARDGGLEIMFEGESVGQIRKNKFIPITEN